MSIFFSQGSLDRPTGEAPIHMMYPEDWDDPGASCPWCRQIGKQYDVSYSETVFRYHGRRVDELPGDNIFVLFSNQAVELAHTVADSVRQLLDLNKLKAAFSKKDQK
jgi:hypothetical protein